MEVIVRPLQTAGEYSHTLVIPKRWLTQLGEPKKVKIIVGRKRLIISPAESEGEGNGGQQR